MLSFVLCRRKNVCKVQVFYEELNLEKITEQRSYEVRLTSALANLSSYLSIHPPSIYIYLSTYLSIYLSIYLQSDLDYSDYSIIRTF